MKKFITFMILICFAGVTGLFAQEEAAPVVLLMYFDDIEIVTPDDEILYDDDLMEEMELPLGATIMTGTFGSAELELRYPQDPLGGTIVKLGEDTTFSVESVSGLNNADTTIFALAQGKARAFKDALFDSGQQEFRGPTSVCGVRGTDYGMEVFPGRGIEEAFVLDGQIDYSRKGADGSMQRIALGRGMMANARGDDFKPVDIPPARLVQFQDSYKFNNPRLQEKEKGMKERKKVPTPEPTEEPTPEPTEEPGGDDVTPPVDEDTPPEDEPPLPLPEDDPLMQWLKDVLGMEIGSITIGDETYAKVVMQPTFEIGKLKTALYLPVIYQKDMFNPANWYHPKGNDEWSFGTDQAQGDYLAIGTDFLSDLFLKIKYLQWGEQRDEFFFKVGNLNNFTIGHGLIMNSYANDADFPSIRRIGVNLGVDREKWGFELMTNDLTDNQIFGGRVYFRPIGKLAIGVSAVTDINPAGDLPEVFSPTNGIPTAEMVGDPVFINAGLDLDLPVFESDLMSAILFADIAGMLPYVKVQSPTLTAVTPGLHGETMLSDIGLRNYGANAGVFGNILMIRYNLHARYFTGTFRPSFYGTNYDRVSGEYATGIAQYIQDIADGNTADYDGIDMGIYGEGGYTMPKVFSLDIGYMWPFAFDENGDLAPASDDELMLQATLEKGVIPGIDLSGSLTYSRTKFAPMLAQKISGDVQPEDKPMGWIDEYTVMKGELIYGVSPNLDLAALLTGAVSRDDNGAVSYDENGKQESAVTFSIETRVHF
jgi:hypothetical protein